MLKDRIHYLGNKKLYSKLRTHLKPKHLVFFGCLVFTYWFIPPVWRLLDDTVEVLQVKRNLEMEQVVVGPKEANWTPYKKIAKCLPSAIITAEDSLFYSHHGFDFASIKQNIILNWRKKKYVRGGSTISQQLVKIGFLDNERSLIRKVREAVGTAIMELLLSKQEILTWYMNLAEFGPGIYGVKSAAQKYFGVSPQGLNLSQCVQLALILPSPVKWSQSLRSKSLSHFAKKRFEGILTNMLRSGMISKTSWTEHMMQGNFGAPVRMVVQIPEPSPELIDLGFSDEVEEPVTQSLQQGASSSNLDEIFQNEAGKAERQEGQPLSQPPEPEAHDQDASTAPSDAEPSPSLSSPQSEAESVYPGQKNDTPTETP